MKNQRVIVLNGMQRGGTNVAWNLLQSHPGIVSPVRETGEVICPAWLGSGRPARGFRGLARRLVRSGFPPMLWHVDQALFRGRMATLDDPDNRFKNRREVYTPEEVRRATLATKSVGRDIEMTPALARFFPETWVISVVRNGFAVCEGWARRGIPVEKAADAYARALEEIFAQSKTLSRHLLVKFEDCVLDPFGSLGRLCRFTGLDAADAAGIRIKSKKTLAADGRHRVQSGETEGRKLWLDRHEVRDYLDPAVAERQVSRLSRQEMDVVARIAGEAMMRAGYDVPASAAK